MQESIKKIIRKFKQHEPYHYTSNKQNQYKKQPQIREQIENKEDTQMLTKKINHLQNTIDKLVTDANRLIKYYQDSIREHIFNAEQLKEEHLNYKLSMIEQSKESQAEIKELSSHIQRQNSQINKKEGEYLSLLQKYEDFEEKVQQIRKEDEQSLIQMEEKIRSQTFLFEEKIIHSEVKSSETKSKLVELTARNEDLQNENDFLKKIAEELMQQNQDLKEKFIEENKQKHFQEMSKSEESECFIECDFDCMSRQQEQQKHEETKMGDSREFYLQNTKQILNISEHYSKHNRTEEILSKDNSNYRFKIFNSNQSKFQNLAERRKSLKSKQPISRLFSNGLMRINTGDSQKSVPSYQPSKQSKIKQVKQFRVVDHSENPTINPYKAFFQLMTQCEKMNSPYFWLICNIELNDLYDKFLKEGIPYNLWQNQIRKALYQKAK